MAGHPCNAAGRATATAESLAWEHLHRQSETQVTRSIRLALDPQHGNAKAGTEHDPHGHLPSGKSALPIPIHRARSRFEARSGGFRCLAIVRHPAASLLNSGFAGRPLIPRSSLLSLSPLRSDRDTAEKIGRTRGCGLLDCRPHPWGCGPGGAQLSTRSSTRRFWARPSALALSATGWLSP